METFGVILLVGVIILSVVAVGLFLTPQVDRGNILVESKPETEPVQTIIGDNNIQASGNLIVLDEWRDDIELSEDDIVTEEFPMFSSDETPDRMRFLDED